MATEEESSAAATTTTTTTTTAAAAAIATTAASEREGGRWRGRGAVNVSLTVYHVPWTNLQRTRSRLVTPESRQSIGNGMVADD